MKFARIAVLGTIISLALGGSAFAHAHIVTAVPEPNGTVTTAPSQVAIDFTEDLEAKASAIRVDDTSGAEVDTGNAHGDPANPKRLIVGLKPLTPGVYKVSWKATAADTHKTHGDYTFTVAK